MDNLRSTILDGTRRQVFNQIGNWSPFLEDSPLSKFPIDKRIQSFGRVEDSEIVQGILDYAQSVAAQYGARLIPRYGNNCLIGVDFIDAD